MTNMIYPTKHWFHQSNNQTLAHLEPQNQVMLLLQSRESGKMQAGVWSCGPWEQEALTQSFTLFCIPHPHQRQRERDASFYTSIYHLLVCLKMPYKLHLLKYIQTTCARVCAALKVSSNCSWLCTVCRSSGLRYPLYSTHCQASLWSIAFGWIHVLSPELKSISIQVLTYRSIHTKFVDVCDALSYQISNS